MFQQLVMAIKKTSLEQRKGKFVIIDVVFKNKTIVHRTHKDTK
jgi:hypothetical protein